MENNTPPSKLDETIKESLSNYDATYDAGDWSRMERMLDTAPKSAMASTFSYNKVLIIGAAVLIGGFLIYKTVGTSKNTTETPVETVVTPSETIPNTNPAPVVAKTTPTITPTIIEQPVVIPEVKISAPEVKTTVVVKSNKEKAIAEKAKKEKIKEDAIDAESLKTQKVSVMGKVPIFGDQLDSKKGIVGETKEKESTKKAAVSKGSNNIGLSGLLHLNADSIRKQKEMLQKDSISH
ncbi:hypothetical protein BH10BAC1_BH10BAC1_01180 [soil metagenome]